MPVMIYVELKDPPQTAVFKLFISENGVIFAAHERKEESRRGYGGMV